MNDKDHGRAQAQAQYESIQQMVAALDLDFDRLAELREQRDEWVDAGGEPGAGNDYEAWARVAPNDAAELAGLESAAGEWEDREDVEQAIHDDPLEMLVCDGWYEPGGETDGPEEFEVLLCTGGPAVRIRGTLDVHCEPERAWLEYQDWGTPWTEFFGADMATLLAYCRQFYFGE